MADVTDLGAFKPTHFAAAGVVGEFVRDDAGAVIGHRVVSARVYPSPQGGEGVEVPVVDGRVPTLGQEPKHFHRPETVVSERHVSGQRLVTYQCACGARLPERPA